MRWSPHTHQAPKHRLHFLSFFSSSFATGALAAASDRKPPTGVPWRFTLRRHEGPFECVAAGCNSQYFSNTHSNASLVQALAAPSAHKQLKSCCE